MSYILPSFDFYVCACALTPDADWAFLPTSLQTGGDEYMFDSDRFGTFKVHGSPNIRPHLVRGEYTWLHNN